MWFEEIPRLPDDEPKGNDKPKYVELCELIPQHAAHWENLGAHLGLQDYDINNIRRNHPNQCEDACREMFMKWLQVDPSPTWHKLDDAIQSMTFNSSSKNLKKSTWITMTTNKWNWIGLIVPVAAVAMYWLLSKR